ncbi:hypothetical protein GCM10009425_42000 [Pseudomonas asuensis]|uniref:Rnf electron transport complex subunit B n=1 Tax=Pseudomonas asuensis TaxID=1825787 RepID=A0ABQ2H2V1_9PSED|nr:electron transport complex subunit RsxB [Pseudomonas asuensis]GGM27064.1 hypothetical protein GCM10009425_42000 [Pseudomonas asuensis]
MSLIHAIDALLPQTQCGKCGHPGCLPYATSIAAGEAINKCPPGGDETIHELAELLGVESVPLDSPYPPTPAQVAFIREAECIGCTKCIQACPVDAIVGAAKLMHTVIAAECTGCELCIAPCPVDCIDLNPLPVQPSREQQRQDAVHYRLRYEARNTRLSREEQRKQTERNARLIRSREAAEAVQTATPVDPIQAAISRIKTQKNDSTDHDAIIKKLKISASTAQMALKKTEKQLAQRATPQLEEQVKVLKQAAQATQCALDEALKKNQSPEQLADTTAAIKRAKINAAMARAQLSKAEKAFGHEPTPEQQEQLKALRESADHAAKTLISLEHQKPSAPADALKKAKLDLIGARAALQSAERNGATHDELACLRQALRQAEEALNVAEATSDRPLPEHIRLQKMPVDLVTRTLKTQIAYAKAEVKRLERENGASTAALLDARNHLIELEDKLSDHLAS